MGTKRRIAGGERTEKEIGHHGQMMSNKKKLKPRSGEKKYGSKSGREESEAAKEKKRIGS